jgi:hypothetical protein
MTLGEGTKADKHLLEHREPRLGVARSDLALFFESSQTRDMHLDIIVQSRGMEDGEASQRVDTPSPRRSRRAGRASSIGRPSHMENVNQRKP